MQKILHKDQYLEILIWLHIIYRAFSSELTSWTFRVFKNQEYGTQVTVQKQTLSGIWMAKVYEGKGKTQNWAEEAIWPRTDRALAALVRCSGAFTVVRVSSVGLHVHVELQCRLPGQGGQSMTPGKAAPGSPARPQGAASSKRSLPKRGGMYLVICRSAQFILKPFAAPPPILVTHELLLF